MKTSKALQILDNQNVAISPMTDIETVYKEDESGNRQKVAPLILGTNMLSVVNSSNNGKYLTGINIKKSDTSNDFAKIECMMDDISTLIDGVLSNNRLSALSNVTLYNFDAPIRMDSITCIAESKINSAHIVLDIDKGLEISRDTSKLNVIFPKIRTNNSSNKSFLEFNENHWYLNALIDENTLEIDASNKLHVKDIPIKKLEVSALASWDPSCTADMPKAYLAGTLKTGLFSAVGSKAINEFKIYYTDTYKDIEFDAIKGITCDKTDSNKIIFGLEDCGSEETGKEYGTAIISNGIIKFEKIPGLQGEQGERGTDASIPEFNLYKTGNENTSIAKLEYRLVDPIDPNGKGPWIDLGEVSYYYNNVITNNYNTSIGFSLNDNSTALPNWNNVDTNVNVVTNVNLNYVDSSTYELQVEKHPLDIVGGINKKIEDFKNSIFDSMFPIGAIVPYAGKSAPTVSNTDIEWRLCNGDTLPDSSLYAKYKSNRGNLTLPNLVGRFIYGSDGANSGYSGGSEKAEKISQDYLPAHRHYIPNVNKEWGDDANDRPFPYNWYADIIEYTAPASKQLDILPPYLKLIYIIRVR